MQFCFINSYAQDWHLKREKDGIKIYTADEPGTCIHTVKLECTAVGNFSQLLAVIFDIDKIHFWTYNTIHSKILKMVNSHEMIFYAEVNTPFPLSNRDYISHLTVAPPVNDTIIIQSHAEPDYLPVNDGIVRVRDSKSHWVVTHAGDNLIKIEYIIHFNPGGNIPAWMINAYIAEGPYDSFVKLRQRMLLPEYKNAVFNFVN